MFVLLILCILQIIRNIKKEELVVLNMEQKLLKNPLIQLFQIGYKKYVTDGIQALCDAIILRQEYFNISTLIEIPVWNYLKFCATRKISSSKIFYVITGMLPRVIVVTVLIIDIFILNTVTYFYSAMFLLGLPLLTKAYCYLCERLADINCYYFGSHLKELPELNRPGFISVGFADNVPPIEDAVDIVTQKDNEELLSWFVKYYDIYNNIKSFILNIKRIETTYRPYEGIYVYGCYVIAWGYLLYLNLHRLSRNFTVLLYALIPDFYSPF